jgi:nucleotide-binding universal stress UspA family protein
MERLISILAVVQDLDSDLAVLDKSVALARTFHARLDLLVRRPAQVETCIAHCEALGFDGVTTCDASSDRLGEAILNRLRLHPADLVVKCLSTENALRRFWFAPGDNSLAESCTAPLLLVRDRPWAAEPRFAAAVDVADRDTEALTRGILHASGFLSQGCNAWLDVLYTEREQQDEALRMERAVRLARLVREFHVGSERLQVFDGAPERTLTALLRQRQYDVLVAGVTSRRLSLSSAFATLTSALVDSTSGDVLLVNSGNSAAEQLAHQRQQLA